MLYPFVIARCDELNVSFFDTKFFSYMIWVITFLNQSYTKERIP